MLNYGSANIFINLYFSAVKQTIEYKNWKQWCDTIPVMAKILLVILNRTNPGSKNVEILDTLTFVVSERRSVFPAFCVS